MTIFDAILQGIIQGLTEFLPVSSSGHLSLVQHFTGQGGEVGGSFSIMLHFGTLVAVMIAFWPTIRDLILEAFRMIGDLFRGKLRFKTRQSPPPHDMDAPAGAGSPVRGAALKGLLFLPGGG